MEIAHDLGSLLIKESKFAIKILQIQGKIKHHCSCSKLASFTAEVSLLDGTSRLPLLRGLQALRGYLGLSLDLDLYASKFLAGIPLNKYFNS